MAQDGEYPTDERAALGDALVACGVAQSVEAAAIHLLPLWSYLVDRADELDADETNCRCIDHSTQS